MSTIDYRQERQTFADGAWTMAHTAMIAAERLKFEDLHPMSSYVRQQDIARMQFARARARGEANPRIVTWTAMQTDRRASQIFPDLSYATHDDEQIISANSFITYALRHMLREGWLRLREYIGDTYEWQVAVPSGQDEWAARAKAALRWLEDDIQLDLYPNSERGTYTPRSFPSFDARRNFARIGRCDFIRHFAQNHARAAAFNTSHFLHEPDDLISHHAGYGDAVGLMVTEGAILRPPIYRRGALLYDGERWRIDTIGLDDIALIVPGDIELRIGADVQLNPAQPQPIAIYTRAGSLVGGRPLQRTPSAPDRSEFLIVNRQVVSWKRGGELSIPQNGFVLSVRDGALSKRAVEDIVADAWVEYRFAAPFSRTQSAIQAGPILLRNGQPADSREEFYASRGGSIGITPVRMNPDGDAIRKARTAIAIKANGDLTLLVVDGCEPASRTRFDSAGASLDETRQLLVKMGARDALNLSGEGSSHLFVESGLANTPSDRRGQPGVVYERMLPSIGIVS
ncbi:MAG: phosphodiester glycosidase family protein [Chloroflexi bacterium]|nr:phosphodiester glycosidase family protein [Chloroflexota bacterium]MCY4246660.1 phosphodiester glycosidase family protein [Chloroflexota bacterium]